MNVKTSGKKTYETKRDRAKKDYETFKKRGRNKLDKRRRQAEQRRDKTVNADKKRYATAKSNYDKAVKYLKDLQKKKP